MSADHDLRCHDAPCCPIARQQPALSVPGVGRCFCGGQQWRLTPRRRRYRFWLFDRSMFLLFVVLLLSLVSPTHAALVNFKNCLPKTISDSNPLQLQFVPLDVNVTFDLENTLHALNVTVYGNVSGTADRSPSYPPPNDPQWADANNTVGKIIDLSISNNKYTTLLTSIQMLSWTPYSNAERFCASVGQGTCPLGPVFYANATDLTQLHAFSIEHAMLSTYAFSTISSTLVIKSGDASAAELGCISVDVTPDLGSPIRGAIRYVPLVILILVGIATVTAAMYSPWGSTDPFHWTSNYGRDEDVLRLITPGFADCLQYIQFVVLTGALSLDYPGYYQPVVSQAAWSSLMFNQSFVSAGNGSNPIVDGVYAINGTYGLDRLNQLVGMEASQDMWPGLMVWTLVIIAAITLLVELAFGLRWLHREFAHIPEEDRRAKNVPFTVGNVIRIVFNYLFLPLTSLSFFQLVIAAHSPAYSVALACVVILILLAFSIWAIRLIVSTSPKSYLFDDLSTVLLYGPLYNTFCDDAAAFAAVPIIVTFMRGIAIGAVQPSGIAQLVLLAICEVVTILTLVAFRPFAAPTSMNIYHGCFSMVRLLAILLSVSFVPSLAVSEGTRGWIGYVILFLHAVVLVFGFFLNALQTLIEVIARLAGAGDYDGGATRGGLVKVVGMRQLARRVPRRHTTRQSLGSEAAILGQAEDRMSSQFDMSRPRSLSGSSAMLLQRKAASDGRLSVGLDSVGGTHSRTNSSGLYTPTTLGGSAAISGAGNKTAGNSSPRGSTLLMQQQDPYYRPPRPRRRTMTGSLDNGKGSSSNLQGAGDAGDGDEDITDVPLASGGGTPSPAYIPAPKDDLDLDDSGRSRTDYAVREVDFYYGVRGPPLSHTGTRRLKTGPADPTGPVSSATGWFRNFFRGKTKEKGKGFEVVRSARAPPPGLMAEGETFNEPYRDDPDETGSPAHSRHASQTSIGSYRDSDGEENSRPNETRRPSLPPIDVGGGIELPSRMGSRASAQVPPITLERPEVPRKSSKRQSMAGSSAPRGADDAVSTDEDSAAEGNGRPELTITTSGQLNPHSGTGRLPFSTNSSVSADRNLSLASTTRSTSSSQQAHKDDRPSSVGYVIQHRASDNIHEASPDEPSFTGSAAELVDEPLHPEHRAP